MKARVAMTKGNKTANGQEQIWKVRAGAKGTGQQFGPVIVVWPWSTASLEQADKIVAEIAERYGLEL